MLSNSAQQEENKHDLPGVSRGFGVIKFLRHRDVLGWWIVHRPSFLNQHCCQFPASPSGRLIFAASPGSAFQARVCKRVPLALPLAAFICALLFTFFFGCCCHSIPTCFSAVLTIVEGKAYTTTLLTPTRDSLRKSFFGQSPLRNSPSLIPGATLRHSC